MADLSDVPRAALLDLYHAVLAHELAYGQQRRALVLSMCVQAVAFGLETGPETGREKGGPSPRASWDRAHDAARLLLGLVTGLDEETADDLAVVCAVVTAGLS